MSITNELIAGQGEKQGNFQKQLALVQIAIDTASSISKAIAGATAAAAATGPAAPLTLAPYIISMVSSVLGAYVKSRALLEKQVPSAPTFADGGGTGQGTYIDSTGHRVAGIVHDNEYVVPKRLLLGDPWVANQVAIIEAIRVGRAPDLASSQMPSQAQNQGVSAGDSGSAALMGALLGRLDSLEAAVRALDKPMGAYFARDEVEAMQKYFDQEESNRRNSRL
jgi:hypothetical protein